MVCRCRGWSSGRRQCGSQETRREFFRSYFEFPTDFFRKSTSKCKFLRSNFEYTASFSGVLALRDRNADQADDRVRKEALENLKVKQRHRVRSVLGYRIGTLKQLQHCDRCSVKMLKHARLSLQREKEHGELEQDCKSSFIRAATKLVEIVFRSHPEKPASFSTLDFPSAPPVSA